MVSLIDWFVFVFVVKASDKLYMHIQTVKYNIRLIKTTGGLFRMSQENTVHCNLTLSQGLVAKAIYIIIEGFTLFTRGIGLNVPILTRSDFEFIYPGAHISTDNYFGIGYNAWRNKTRKRSYVYTKVWISGYAIVKYAV